LVYLIKFTTNSIIKNLLLNFFNKKIIPFQEIFPEGFNDIHSHLLPGIDDGVKSMENSIELIQLFRSIGIKNITTTPHTLGEVWPNTPEIINNKLALVKAELIKQNITDVNLTAASEYMLDEKFMELLEQKKLLTIKDNFILIEFSYINHPENILEIIFEIQTKGYKPILAHPERYNYYHNKFKMYEKLKLAGCYFQMNLLSLTNYYGNNVQKIAVKLLENNMIDFLGTDVHHKNHFNALSKLGTKKNIELLSPILMNNQQLKIT